MNKPDLCDPKGLIREAFAIKNIGAPECRSIFLDWALGVPPMLDTVEEVHKLLAHYAPAAAIDHPMVLTLRAALGQVEPPRRRGGRQARIPN